MAADARRAALHEEAERADARLEVEVRPGRGRVEDELRAVRAGLHEEAALAAGQRLDVLGDERRDVPEAVVEADRVVADRSGDGHFRSERVERPKLRLEAGERLVPGDPGQGLTGVVLAVLVRVEPDVVGAAGAVEVELLDFRR